ncbi:hypothetical protein Fsol_00630 [Candidatus Fokinia solitaria]|uniref:Uncharacterized protein n=1 Tax=Candidatus Fokinia solitaria TaxID=1802984 RepID=A0A2U8BSU0_9RICK|nr:hypothetical protein [Candidatus Fokinia solitaria]AWD33409.1 hypothetical protein Fsol_00630 [Candidatus Fokinia solitaria]
MPLLILCFAVCASLITPLLQSDAAIKPNKFRTYSNNNHGNDELYNAIVQAAIAREFSQPLPPTQHEQELLDLAQAKHDAEVENLKEDNKRKEAARKEAAEIAKWERLKAAADAEKAKSEKLKADSDARKAIEEKIKNIAKDAQYISVIDDIEANKVKMMRILKRNPEMLEKMQNDSALEEYINKIMSDAYNTETKRYEFNIGSLATFYTKYGLEREDARELAWLCRRILKETGFLMAVTRAKGDIISERYNTLDLETLMMEIRENKSDMIDTYLQRVRTATLTQMTGELLSLKERGVISQKRYDGIIEDIFPENSILSPYSQEMYEELTNKKHASYGTKEAREEYDINYEEGKENDERQEDNVSAVVANMNNNDGNDVTDDTITGGDGDNGGDNIVNNPPANNNDGGSIKNNKINSAHPIGMDNDTANAMADAKSIINAKNFRDLPGGQIASAIAKSATKAAIELPTAPDQIIRFVGDLIQRGVKGKKNFKPMRPVLDYALDASDKALPGISKTLRPLADVFSLEGQARLAKEVGLEDNLGLTREEKDNPIANTAAHIADFAVGYGKLNTPLKAMKAINPTVALNVFRKDIPNALKEGGKIAKDVGSWIGSKGENLPKVWQGIKKAKEGMTSALRETVKSKGTNIAEMVARSKIIPHSLLNAAKGAGKILVYEVARGNLKGDDIYVL